MQGCTCPAARLHLPWGCTHSQDRMQALSRKSVVSVEEGTRSPQQWAQQHHSMRWAGGLIPQALEEDVSLWVGKISAAFAARQEPPEVWDLTGCA